jgi:biopolymer transport protein ExbD
MSQQSFDKAEPNLTPLLDMVFQLITFFMLVINFQGASLDLSLKLPVLGSARPLDRHGKLEPMVLNIDKDGNVKVQGRKVDFEKYIEGEARLLKSHLRLLNTPIKDGELPVGVIIRGDRSVPFQLINRVLKACQFQGYRQFSLRTMSHEEAR